MKYVWFLLEERSYRGKILIVEDEVNIRGGLVRMVINVDEKLEVYETVAAKRLQVEVKL